MSVRITGLEDLHKQLQTLPARVERNIMAGAVNQGINIMRDAAKKNVDSADVRKSIRSRQVKGKPGEIIREVYVKEKFYAKFLEFGTASFYAGTGKTVGGPYAIKPKKSKTLVITDGENTKYFGSAVHPGIRPQPFMRPAFDTNQGKAMQAVKIYIEKRLPQEFGLVPKQTITRRMILEALDDES